MNAFDYFFEKSKTLDKEFLIGSKEKISFKELYKQSIHLSQYIIDNTGEDEKIPILSHNNVFFLICYFAIIRSGRVCVPLNPDVEPSNLEYILTECESNHLFIHNRLQGKHSTDDLICVSDLEEVCKPYLSNTPEKTAEAFDSERCAEIIFTSGSTGAPKGVMISHKNLIANTDSIVEYLNLTSKDIMLVVLPFYYCYGLSLLHTHLRVGGSIVLNNTFIFLGSILNDLKKYECTGFAGVPSHFQILLRKSDSFKETNFPHLRYVTQAGGKLHNVFITEFNEAHPEVDFFVMYGQTEATARLSYLPADMLKEKLGSIGKGIPNVELRVVSESGDTIKPGEIGEIIAKGDNIMLGYFKDTEASKKTIKDNWLQTGDLGTIDEDNYIYLKARSKEIIKVGGKRISPKEIEEVIVSIPEVIDCSIIGVQDDILGEAIKAVITVDRSNLNELTPDTIKAYCSKHLAIYKLPKFIEIKDKLSISATGKKLKSDLK